MSLLLDHGHPHAWRYPLGLVFAEAKLVSRRIDVQTASQFSLLQLALSAQPNMNVKPSATKRMVNAFNKTIKDLLGDGEK